MGFRIFNLIISLKTIVWFEFTKFDQMTRLRDLWFLVNITI